MTRSILPVTTTMRRSFQTNKPTAEDVSPTLGEQTENQKWSRVSETKRFTLQTITSSNYRGEKNRCGRYRRSRFIILVSMRDGVTNIKVNGDYNSVKLWLGVEYQDDDILMPDTTVAVNVSIRAFLTDFIQVVVVDFPNT